MERTELWNAYCARNPSFEGGGTVTITADGLKKLFDQTYTMAYEEGKKDAPTPEAPKHTGYPFGDIFK